jgi:hypothetical protein
MWSEGGASFFVLFFSISSFFIGCQRAICDILRGRKQLWAIEDRKTFGSKGMGNA